MPQKIIFLDIDGVLLSRRAWAMSVNEAALNVGRKNLEQFTALSVFDPVGVALINRLCRCTGALIVISSLWRYSVNPDRTRDKLIEQGIDESLFHPTEWYCHLNRRRQDKEFDITDWIENIDQSGMFVTIDDGDLLPFLVRTNADDGITSAVYRISCRALGGTDSQMGVHALPEADLEQVSLAFRGDRIAASQFLERGEHDTNASLLVPSTRHDWTLMRRTHFYELLAKAAMPEPKHDIGDDFL